MYNVHTVHFATVTTTYYNILLPALEPLANIKHCIVLADMKLSVLESQSLSTLCRVMSSIASASFFHL